MFDIYSHIEELGRRAGYRTMTALCSAAGVPRATMSELKQGRSKSITTKTAKKFAELLGLPLDAICLPPETVADSDSLSVEERRVALQYRALDNHGRRLVETVLVEELRRVNSVDHESMKVVPLFGVAFAAGPGEPDNGAPWEDYKVPCSTNADFAIRVSGDSMEPALHDGEIVLCVKRRPEVGDVCVMLVNGAFYVKQYITDGHNVYLRSLNRERSDADLDLWETGSDSVKCFGTVILPHRPALVEG